MTTAQQTAIGYLTNLGEEMSKEDNRATAEPIWQVREVAIEWGIDPEYDHQVEMYKCDGEEVDEGEEGLLKYIERLGIRLPEKYEKVYGRKTYRVVQAFFTEEAANNYIDQNKHNLNEPYTYVESLYRNYQMIAIRDVAKALWAEAQGDSKP